MSYMLKSAAMTLLSKTLQTFLYKYLKDVDVEGVAMPSIMDADGHSGWGVRLCNVKLREGVELVTLPGKRKIAVKRRRKRKRSWAGASSTNSGAPSATQQSEVVTTVMHNDEAVLAKEEREDGVQNEKDQVIRAEPVLGTGSSIVADPKPKPGRLSRELSFNKQRNKAVTQQPSVHALPTANNRSVEVDVTKTTEGDLNNQSNLSSRANTPPPAPLICSQRTTSMMSCLSRERTTVVDTDDEDDTDAGRIEAPSTPPSFGNPLAGMDAVASTRSNGIIKTNVVFDTRDLEKSRSRARSLPFQNSQPQRSSSVEEFDETDLPQATPVSNSRSVGENDGVEKGFDTGSVVDDDYDEEEEEDVILEEDVVLQLGNGGRIGTLDVRLVGRDLHITVEDALLTVEACPKPDDVDDSASISTVSTAETTKSDKTRTKTKEKKKATKKPPPKKVTPLTDGEKVMEASAIARALGAIPHLFLRDVRVRFVMRKEPLARKDDGTIDDELQADDSVIELGVEMFSVSTGEHILENVRLEEESDIDSDEDVAPPPAASQQRKTTKPSLKALEEADENEYLVKRIRTGSGPDGGISIRVYPAFARRPSNAFTLPRQVQNPDLEWAWQRWDAHTQHSLFRLSSLDIRTRIYLGKKKDIALRNNDYAWYGEEYEEYTIDSMLFGVDYIAPGPPPSLPPIDSRSGETTGTRNRKKFVLEADDYNTDQNGIQSSRIRSCFHKVARGLVPTLCKKTHLPGDYCPYCWENPSRPNSYSEHPLDSFMPLPGMILNISLNDPLELNADQYGLEVLGELKSLFTSNEKSDTSLPKVEEEEPDQPEEKQRKKWTFRKQKPKKESIKDAFPRYMQPENVEVMGLHVAKIVLRLHVMRKEASLRSQPGFFTYRYWELKARCITMDMQKLTTTQKNLVDVRFDLGYLTLNEFGGVNNEELLAIGLPIPDVSDNVSDTNSLSSGASGGSNPTSKAKSNPLWPSTSSTLLHVPVPLETLEYSSKERHGLQLRFVSLEGLGLPVKRSSANVRLGAIKLDATIAIKTSITDTIDVATTSILGNQDEIAPTESPSVQESVADNTVSDDAASSLKWKVHIDSADAWLRPMVRTRLPTTKLAGESSSREGLAFHTILRQVEVEFGKQAVKRKKHLSIQQLASLPETIRVRILMCLNDLEPLEHAFRIAREGNFLLRCRSVNRAIVRYGKLPVRVLKKKRSKVLGPSDIKGSGRRQTILTEIMKLDDAQLEKLWSDHSKPSSTGDSTK